MMKTSSKLLVTGAASMLGVALAAGGAYAATGSLTPADAPGQVLQVSGVGPAAAHASVTATVHANAKGLGGGEPTSARDKAVSHPTSMPIAAAHRSVSQVVRPAPKTLPAYHAVMPSSHASMHPAVPVQVHAPAMMVPVSPMR